MKMITGRPENRKLRCGFFRGLRRDERGATAIEFGLLVVPFLAIISAIFEIGYVSFENEMLASAVTGAARQMMTGQMQGAGATTNAAQFVANYLCPATGRRIPNNFNCAKLVVDVRTAASFTSSNVTNSIYKSGTNQFCPGAPGQIVVMRVTYPLGAIFPLSLFNRTAGVVNDVPNTPGNYHILMGSALFQEENYAVAYTPPSGC